MKQHINAMTTLLGIVLAIQISSAQAREISSKDASLHLSRKVEAVYPEMAQIAHIQGYVNLRVTISETGEVTDVRPVFGHPLLVEAAVAALRQWRYSPFEIDGHPASVVTSVAIAFPSSLPPSIPENEQHKDKFYGYLMSCTSLVTNRQAAKAEPLCRQAVAMSSELDAREKLFRMEARKYLGHALLFQGKTREALQEYREELAIAQIESAGHEDELAEAYVNVGNAMRGSEDLAGASQQYTQAEQIYRHLGKGAVLKSLNNKGAYDFWHLLRDHAEILRQMGQPSAAASLEKEAAGLIVNADTPN